MSLAPIHKLSRFNYHSWVIIPISERDKLGDWSILYEKNRRGKDVESLLKKIRQLVKTYHTHTNPQIKVGDIEFLARKINRDIVCGFHSGFPPCCVKHYVTVWSFAYADPKCSYYAKHYSKMDKKTKYIMDRRGNVKTNIGYIPCPKCLSKENFVKVKRCPKPKDCYWTALLKADK